MSSDGGGGSSDASGGPNVRTADGEKLPFDAAAVAELLHSMGVTDYEPRVVHQLLEVYNRHVRTSLQHAKTFADRNTQSVISTGDVQLGIEATTKHEYQTAYRLQTMQRVDASVNLKPLPRIPAPSDGLRLPPVQHLLTQPNAVLYPRRPPVAATGGGGSSAASHKRPSTVVFKRRKRPVAGKDKKDKPTSFGAIQFDPSSVTQPGEGAHVETRSFGV